MMQAQNVQITPPAILAAILFHINNPVPVKITPDDGGEPFEVMAEPIGLEREGDALVCVLPLERAMHYATNTYDFKVKVDAPNNVMIVSFEKRADGGGILAANGKPVARDSFAINNLLARLNDK